MAVMIGVDPHKGSHTAVAIDRDETELASVTVRATRRQVDELLAWAARFEDRIWAIESAGGLGYLLARQLVAAGEQVLDVPATLAARVRVLGSGRSNKNDSNDARSVAIAALHAPRLARVGRDDHAGVLRLYAKLNQYLGRARNSTACPLKEMLVMLLMTRFIVRTFESALRAIAKVRTIPASIRRGACLRSFHRQQIVAG